MSGHSFKIHLSRLLVKYWQFAVFVSAFLQLLNLTDTGSTFLMFFQNASCTFGSFVHFAFEAMLWLL